MDKTRYIFITGGVLSSLGKGVAAASIANLLEFDGFRVTLIKLDPYLNVDPGTMSPFQHGEVFVTDDGAETDLDLGHYERFTNATMTQKNNWTAGRIYEQVIKKERKGAFLGKTVQIIPHVTDEIKKSIFSFDGKYQVVIVEIGGTVGDIESLPFLEAIRQIGLELDEERVMFIHLTLVPFMKTAGELKTKPTQHSVKELQSIGIQPDLLLCRSEIALPQDIKRKIALFTNLKEEDIISAVDVDSIYEVPLNFKKEGLGRIILRKMKIEPVKDDFSRWENWILQKKKITDKVNIAIVGKYIKFGDSYKSLFEALNHAGVENRVMVNTHLIEADSLLDWNLDELFHDMQGILIPGGFGIRGIEGMIKAAEYARLKRIPYFGICLGMQVAVIEFARHVCGIDDAHSSEFQPASTNKVFLKLRELSHIEDMGHNMRLGKYVCVFKKNSLAYSIYNKKKIEERHRHRYEFNPKYEKILENKGMVISGKNPERDLVEIVELENHPWYIGVQFHPEFKSRPLTPHPIFISFIKNAIELKKTAK